MYVGVLLTQVCLGRLAQWLSRFILPKFVLVSLPNHQHTGSYIK